MIQLNTENERRRWFGVLFIVILVGVVGWGTQQMLNSPRPWFDEGIYLQAAKHIAEDGVFGIQTSPGIVSRLDRVTVGYPLLVPLALVFKLFGTTLEVARAMMVGWIVAFVALAGILIQQLYGRRAAILAMLIAGTFGPLYGTGKNVLGEVPGLVYVLTTAVGLLAIEQGKRGWWVSIATGVSAALAIATKPSFLILLPCLFLTLVVWWFRRVRLSWREYVGALGGLFVGLLVWVLTQFGSQSFARVWAHYSNPYGIADLTHQMWKNIVGLVTHATPVHLLLLGALTCAAWWIRGWRKLSAIEYYLAAFVLLVLASYIRTAGWYRYFFLGQMIVLILAPASLYGLCVRWMKAHALRTSMIGSLILVGVNIVMLWREPFPLFGTEWRELRAALQTDTVKRPWFVNASEAAFFYQGKEYHQYLKIMEHLHIGEPIIPKEPLVDVVVMTDTVEEVMPLVEQEFTLERRFGHVGFWRRKGL